MQRRVYKAERLPLRGEAMVDSVRDNVLAAQHELGEVLDTTGWKQWKKTGYGEVDRKQYIDELADVILFVLNLAIVQRVTGAELAQAIFNKWRLNARRQRQGY